jgi:hypothetical protein
MSSTTWTATATTTFTTSYRFTTWTVTDRSLPRSSGHCCPHRKRATFTRGVGKLIPGEQDVPIPVGSLWSLSDEGQNNITCSGIYVTERRDEQSPPFPGMTALVVGIQTRVRGSSDWVQIVHGSSVSFILSDLFLCHFSPLPRGQVVRKSQS